MSKRKREEEDEQQVKRQKIDTQALERLQFLVDRYYKIVTSDKSKPKKIEFIDNIIDYIKANYKDEILLNQKISSFLIDFQTNESSYLLSKNIYEKLKEKMELPTFSKLLEENEFKGERLKLNLEDKKLKLEGKELQKQYKINLQSKYDSLLNSNSFLNNNTYELNDDCETDDSVVNELFFKKYQYQLNQKICKGSNVRKGTDEIMYTSLFQKQFEIAKNEFNSLPFDKTINRFVLVDGENLLNSTKTKSRHPEIDKDIDFMREHQNKEKYISNLENNKNFLADKDFVNRFIRKDTKLQKLITNPKFQNDKKDFYDIEDDLKKSKRVSSSDMDFYRKFKSIMDEYQDAKDYVRKYKNEFDNLKDEVEKYYEIIEQIKLNQERYNHVYLSTVNLVLTLSEIKNKDVNVYITLHDYRRPNFIPKTGITTIFTVPEHSNIKIVYCECSIPDTNEFNKKVVNDIDNNKTIVQVKDRHCNKASTIVGGKEISLIGKNEMDDYFIVAMNYIIELARSNYQVDITNQTIVYTNDRYRWLSFNGNSSIEFRTFYNEIL